MKRLVNNIISIGIYSLVIGIIFFPTLGFTWTLFSISLFSGLVLSFLNEIIKQLRKLNGEKFEE